MKSSSLSSQRESSSPQIEQGNQEIHAAHSPRAGVVDTTLSMVGDNQVINLNEAINTAASAMGVETVESGREGNVVNNPQDTGGKNGFNWNNALLQYKVNMPLTMK